MNQKPTSAPNTSGRKGPETNTNDYSQVRQQKQANGDKSVKTPQGEGQGGGEPPGRSGMGRAKK